LLARLFKVGVFTLYPFFLLILFACCLLVWLANLFLFCSCKFTVIKIEKVLGYVMIRNAMTNAKPDTVSVDLILKMVWFANLICFVLANLPL